MLANYKRRDASKHKVSDLWLALLLFIIIAITFFNLVFLTSVVASVR